MDIEELYHKEALLKANQAYLKEAELQAAHLGLTPPISLILDIKRCKTEIAQLQMEIVNYKNSQRKIKHNLTYLKADDIIEYSDTNGEIETALLFKSLDLHLYNLLPTLAKLSDIVDMFLSIINVSTYIHADNISENRQIHSLDNDIEIYSFIDSAINQFNNRNLDITSITIFFYSDSENALIRLSIEREYTEFSIKSKSEHLDLIKDIYDAFVKLLTSLSGD